MMNISEIIIQLKKQIAMEQYVFYQGSRYIPACLIYWFDRVQNQWNYSVELMDPTHKNSTVRKSLLNLITRMKKWGSRYGKFETKMA